MADQPLSRLSFFKARDLLDTELDYEKLIPSATQNLVFRYLLEHTVFNKKADDYGWVTKNALDPKQIMARTSLKRTAFYAALGALADLGMINRVPRPILSGGSDPDLIEITWLPMCRETALPDVPGNGTQDVPGNGTSFLTREEPEEEHHHGDVTIASLSSQSQNQAPAGAGPSAQTEGPGIDHSVDWADPEDGGAIAEMLGVPLASIGRPFRAWFDRWRTDAWAEIWAGCDHPDACTCPCECPGDDPCGCICPTSGNNDVCECPCKCGFVCEHRRLAGVFDRAEIHAIEDANGKRSPVGYLKETLPGKVATALHKAR